MRRCWGSPFLAAAAVVLASPALEAALPPAGVGTVRLTEQLDGIRREVLQLQQGLLDGFQARAEARTQIKRIRTLMALQKREKELGRRRLKELESTVLELETRRSLLAEKIDLRRQQVRARVRALLAEPEHLRSPIVLDDAGAKDSVRRRVVDSLARTGLHELEELRVDLADARTLESRISDERQQLTNLFVDLEEQEGILQLNEQLQVDLLKREHAARVGQLESYRRLKSSEAHVERLIGEFHSRRELEQLVERDRARVRAQRAIEDGIFPRLKGSLPLPVSGRVVSQFGKAIDPESRLSVFKKGIDIQAEPGSPVRSVAAGKVAFSGDLTSYGKVLILDHGDHYYTLCGNLGETRLKAGDGVGSGDVLGQSRRDGAPVYFEIRTRNIPVNPLQWVSSSISLSP